jgi:hypothetical protein
VLELAPHAPSSPAKLEPLLVHLELEAGRFAPFEYQYFPDLVYDHALFNAFTVQVTGSPCVVAVAKRSFIVFTVENL